MVNWIKSSSDIFVPKYIKLAALDCLGRKSMTPLDFTFFVQVVYRVLLPTVIISVRKSNKNGISQKSIGRGNNKKITFENLELSIPLLREILLS